MKKVDLDQALIRALGLAGNAGALLVYVLDHPGSNVRNAAQALGIECSHLWHHVHALHRLGWIHLAHAPSPRGQRVALLHPQGDAIRQTLSRLADDVVAAIGMRFGGR